MIIEEWEQKVARILNEADKKEKESFVTRLYELSSYLKGHSASFLSSTTFFNEECEYFHFYNYKSENETSKFIKFLKENKGEFLSIILNKQVPKEEKNELIELFKKYYKVAKHSQILLLNKGLTKENTVNIPTFLIRTKKLAQLEKEVLIIFFIEESKRDDLAEKYFLSSFSYLEKKYNVSHGAFMQGLNGLIEKNLISFQKTKNNKRIAKTFDLNIDEIYDKKYFEGEEDSFLYTKIDIKIMKRTDVTWVTKIALISAKNAQKLLNKPSIKAAAGMIGKSRQAVSRILNKVKNFCVKMRNVFENHRCIGTEFKIIDQPPKISQEMQSILKQAMAL